MLLHRLDSTFKISIFAVSSIISTVERFSSSFLCHQTATINFPVTINIRGRRDFQLKITNCNILVKLNPTITVAQKASKMQNFERYSKSLKLITSLHPGEILFSN